MKLKKIAAFALAGVMSVMQVSVLAADTENEDKYSEAINIMRSLGFMKNIPSDDSNSAVTKGMFAAAVVNLMGAKIGTSEFVSPFSDVNESTLYYNEICYAASCGIIHGGTNAKFDPEAGITYREALVMLVNALGYYDYAINSGGYPSGYMKVASDIQLTKGIHIGETTRLTSGMCAQLLYNAGEANMAEVTMSSKGIAITKGEKLFWEKHNIAKATGILEANAYTSVYGSEGMGKNRVKISDVTASVYYSNESINYLGYNVEYYYRENNNDITVLYMIPEKNEITVADADDIHSFSDDTLSYEDNNRIKNLKIEKSLPVIYNGVYTNTYYFEDGQDIFTPDNGEVKIIDNNNDGKADVISILDYNNIVVSAININEDIIYDKYNHEMTLDFTDKENINGGMWVITDKDGNVRKYNEIKEKEIMSVILSMDKKVMRGVVSDKVVKGTLSRVAEDDGKTVVIVDSTEYEIANKNLVNIPTVGENVALHLDFSGKVADIVSEAASESGYAFVMKKYLDDNIDRYYIKLLLADGSKKDFLLAEKVRVDGESYSGNGLNVFIRDSFNDYQVVTVKRNNRDEINVIDTVQTNKSGNYDTLRAFGDAPVTTGYFSSLGSFGGKMITTARTVVFKTPSEAAKNQYDLYSVGSLPQGTNVKLTVRGYCSDPDSFTADCIQYVSDSSAGFGSTSPYMVISAINNTVNESDETITRISGFDQNGAVTINVDTSYTPGTYGVEINTLGVGDVVKYSKNERGELSCVSPVHKTGSELPGKFVEDFQADIYWNSRTEAFGRADFFSYVGYLLAKEDRTIALVEAKTDLTHTNLQPEIMFKVMDNTKVYYVSKARKLTVEAVSNQNISYMSDYKNTRREQQVAVITSNGEPRMIVVYE